MDTQQSTQCTDGHNGHKIKCIDGHNGHIRKYTQWAQNKVYWWFTMGQISSHTFPSPVEICQPHTENWEKRKLWTFYFCSTVCCKFWPKLILFCSQLKPDWKIVPKTCLKLATGYCKSAGTCTLICFKRRKTHLSNMGALWHVLRVSFWCCSLVSLFGGITFWCHCLVLIAGIT